MKYHYPAEIKAFIHAKRAEIEKDGVKPVMESDLPFYKGVTHGKNQILKELEILISILEGRR